MAKIRNGFVSNSSSSSFIIAVQGDLDCGDRIPIEDFPEWSIDETTIRPGFRVYHVCGPQDPTDYERLLLSLAKTGAIQFVKAVDM